MFRCLRPFKIEHTCLWKNQFELFFHEIPSKTKQFHWFMKKKIEAKFGFLWKLFSISPVKSGFRTEMESSAAATLQFEDLSVKNNVFLKDVCIRW